ncbi:MAG: hypothetical protein AMXMBFR64_55430 [Myxococcales bacterium]
MTLGQGAVGGHVGVLYRVKADAPHRHLHLAWHRQLCDEPSPDDLGWVEPAFLDDLGAVRTAACLVARRRENGSLPYGFEPRDAAIGAEGVVRLRSASGLTCSTFVLLLFRYAGFELIDQPTWGAGTDAARRAEDDAAQRALVEYLRGRDPAHAACVEVEVGAIRVRAEEVAAASGIAPQPVTFEVAEPVGRRLLREVGAPAAPSV